MASGTNELPAIHRINKTVVGTNGADGGFPAMNGIGGHLGPPEVVKKGGLRGHHGHMRLGMKRNSTSTRAPLSGRKPAREDLRE